jgi:hypothetical protein
LLLLRSDRLLIATTVRDASPNIAQQPFGLNIAGLPVVPPPVDPCRSHAVPHLEDVCIVLPHLLLSGETVAELIEDQIGVDGRDTADQDYQHPFHGFCLRSCLLTTNNEACANVPATGLAGPALLNFPRPDADEVDRFPGFVCHF